VGLASGWDALTAVGTLALAVITAVAVIVTLAVTYQDRKRTDRRVEEQRHRDLEFLQEQQASDV
jgi:hypothetical protein